MTVGNPKSYWCASRSAMTSLYAQSTVVQLESRVPGNWPARFGAGERPQGPTYRYMVKNYAGVSTWIVGQIFRTIHLAFVSRAISK